MLLGTAHHFAIGSGAFREGRVFSNFEGMRKVFLSIIQGVPTNLSMEKISFSEKLSMAIFYGQFFLKTVRDPC